MTSLGREHPLRLFAKRLSRAKRADLYFCFTPSERLRDLAHAQFFAFFKYHHHSILGLERVEQAMRQVVGLAPLLCFANQLLGRRTIHQLHPLYFRCTEVADQFFRPAPPPAQLVITQVHDDRAQPTPKRHLSPISRAISSSEKKRRHKRSTRWRCRPASSLNESVCPARTSAISSSSGLSVNRHPALLLADKPNITV